MRFVFYSTVGNEAVYDRVSPKKCRMISFSDDDGDCSYEGRDSLNIWQKLAKVLATAGLHKQGSSIS